MNTSSRLSPISPRSSSSSCPARPTNGRPWRSSSAPGRLADEHQVGVGVAGAEDDLGPGLARAGRACSPTPRGRPRRAARGAPSASAIGPPACAALRLALRPCARCLEGAFGPCGARRCAPPACAPRAAGLDQLEARRLAPSSAATVRSRRTPGTRRVSVPTATRASKRAPHVLALELVDRHGELDRIRAHGRRGQLSLPGDGRDLVEAWTGRDIRHPDTAQTTEAVWYLVRELERDLPDTARHYADAAATAPIGDRRRAAASAARSPRAATSAGLDGPLRRPRRCADRLRAARGRGAPLRARRRDRATPASGVAAGRPRLRSSATQRRHRRSTPLGAGRRRAAPRPSPPPAADVPDARRRPRRRPVRRRRARARRRSAFARALARGARDAPFEVPEDSRAAYHAAASMASNFLVALEESAAELLATAGIEDARELLAPLVLRTAANWAERGADGADRPDRPRRRGDRRTRTSRRSPRPRPSCCPLYEALAERTRAHRPRRKPMRTVAHQGRAARGARAPARRRRARSASSRRWAPSTTATSRLLRGGAGALRRRRHEPVRQPGAVRPRRGPRRATRATRSATSTSPRRTGVDLVYAPDADEVYPRRLRDPSRSGDLTDGARRRPRAARRRATSAASRPSSRSCSTPSGPTSPSSARRTRSRRS